MVKLLSSKVYYKYLKRINQIKMQNIDINLTRFIYRLIFKNIYLLTTRNFLFK